MWSLYENEKFLEPLVFSNGKTQADIVSEVNDAIKEGYKIIFIKGKCGTGKSAVALNLAKEFGKTSIIVPIKSLQEQYSKDYFEKKYVLNNGKKLKISSIIGRQNFKCRFIEEFKEKFDFNLKKEKDLKIEEFLENFPLKLRDNGSCDNDFIPCKIEIKEKNLEKLKDYINENPSINFSDFSSINEIKRLSIAPVCQYWSPLYAEDFEIRKFKDSKKLTYLGLNNKKFTIYQRKPGCPYYGQYSSYAEADVLIFNSRKYLIESMMDRKPSTELEIIDECDEFLDSFTIEEKINLNRVIYYLSNMRTNEEKERTIINYLLDISNSIKISDKFSYEKIYEIKNTLIQELLEAVIQLDLIDLIEDEETNYLFHLDKVARTFYDFIEETFFSIEKEDNLLTINLVTINLEKRFNELLEKNRVFIMMSGTIHSENVLKNIFGIKNFKIIEAETRHQGGLIRRKYGYESDCSFESFKKQRITRERYLKSLSKSISCAKPPVLVHVNSFSDLPTKQEKIQYNLENLPAKQEFIYEQENDLFGKRILDFKNKKIDILFTTKCSRGMDFPGDTCNSIVITKFPYPDISSIFWKIFRKIKPQYFMSFYMDKAHRELLQKIYRGLRSENDRIELLSPDIRVLDFSFEKEL